MYGQEGYSGFTSTWIDQKGCHEHRTKLAEIGLSRGTCNGRVSFTAEGRDRSDACGDADDHRGLVKSMTFAARREECASRVLLDCGITRSVEDDRQPADFKLGIGANSGVQRQAAEVVYASSVAFVLHSAYIGLVFVLIGSLGYKIRYPYEMARLGGCLGYFLKWCEHPCINQPNLQLRQPAG
jgi:hypothetical protein